MATKVRTLTDNVRLVSYPLLAEMLGISTSQVFALRERGRIPLKTIRLGGSVRFRRDDCERWISEGCPVNFRGGVR